MCAARLHARAAAAGAREPSLVGGTVIDRILDACLAGRDLSLADAARLSEVNGPELEALCGAADRMRAAETGELVSYVVNRNINFTNVCVMSCGFCAFSRSHRSEEAYFLGVDEVVRRAL